MLQPSGCHSCSQSLLSVALGTLPFPQGPGELCPGAQAVFPWQDGVVWPGQHQAVASAERSPALVSRHPGRVPLPGLHRPDLPGGAWARAGARAAGTVRDCHCHLSWGRGEALQLSLLSIHLPLELRALLGLSLTTQLPPGAGRASPHSARGTSQKGFGCLQNSLFPLTMLLFCCI